MSQKKKMLMNFLWFLVGMAAIAAIPLLLIEQCAGPGKPDVKENLGQQQGSADHSGVKQAICGNLKFTCHTV